MDHIVEERSNIIPREARFILLSEFTLGARAHFAVGTKISGGDLWCPLLPSNKTSTDAVLFWPFNDYEINLDSRSILQRTF